MARIAVFNKPKQMVTLVMYLVTNGNLCSSLTLFFPLYYASPKLIGKISWDYQKQTLKSKQINIMEEQDLCHQTRALKGTWDPANGFWGVSLINLQKIIMLHQSCHFFSMP